MAQYRVPDAEEYMECPYDRTHMIRVKRFPYHLMKCRYNYTGSDFASCPFNAKHEMPRPELRYHLGVCPDRAAIEIDLAHAARREADVDIDRGCVDLPAYENVHIPQSECWDEEASSNPRIGVDPSHFSKFKFVNLPGLSTSEKKDLKKNWNVPIDQKMAEWSSMKQEEQIAEEERSLRRPFSIPSNYSQATANSTPATLPATVFNYSVGIGRGSMNQEPAQVVKPGKGRSYGRGRGILKPGVLQQEQVNGIHRSTAPPPPGIFSIGRGSMAVRDPDVSFSGSMEQPSFVVPTVQNGGVRRPISFGLAGSMACVTPSTDETFKDSPAEEPDQSVTEGEAFEDAKNRNTKRFLKKLRQIEVLEQKQQEGYILTTDEEKKMSKKKDLLEKLANLQMK
ncbi:hypothetical protein CHS0354_026569 [Potamilus streckersoni]|uniref:CHHC U11-48K-type domain-containing protein n=1 Tax=Potamilus streckersoni TaxID=2493646 RepID=A0AAE0SU04_9BIVA|nr:hypothetical protein CHS0354_026569 [Potamilus streckersoni]